MPNVHNYSGVRPSSKLSPREIRKPTEDTTKPTGEDMKIQRGELMKILLWVKIMHTWFSLKHKNGWVTFKCQKILQILSKKNRITCQIILKGSESNPISQPSDEYCNYKSNLPKEVTIYFSRPNIWYDVRN